MEEADRNEHWKDLFLNDYNTLITQLQETQAADIADFLSHIEIKHAIEIFNDIHDTRLQGNVFAELDHAIQLELFKFIPKKTFANIFVEMLSESRVIFYRQLSLQEQTRLLPFLDKNIRQDVTTLSAYSDDTAGGIMSTDFSFIFGDMTVANAIEKIKADAPSKKMLFYIYVVDDDMNLLGVISLQNIILADKDKTVSEYMNDNFIFSYVDEDREIVSSKIEKYSLVAIPILNDDGQLVGIVKYDDAITILKEEQTEDIEKLMGITSSGENSEYLQIPALKHYLKRIGWIVTLFLMTILTSFTMHHYEEILNNIPVLALYLPMITSTGGNTGSQAASVIIRALSLEEIEWKNIFTVLLKEFKISLMIACTLFFFVVAKIISFSYFDDPHCNICVLSCAIGLALSTQVVVSIFIGTTLPMIVKFFKMDPSVIASPAITTLVDVTGVIIYFSLVRYFIPFL